MILPDFCFHITGRIARVTFIGPVKAVASCRSIWRERKFFKIAAKVAGRIVDQHIDAPKVRDGGLCCSTGIGRLGDVQSDNQQVVRRC